MAISGLDHCSFPLENVEEMLAFYKRLGVDVVGEDAWRAGKRRYLTLSFGDNKINMHAPDFWRSPEFTLRGPTALPGCADICFVWDGSQESLHAMLAAAGAEIIEGPVPRAGGRSRMRDMATSVYIRDPDQNLLEFMVY